METGRLYTWSYWHPAYKQRVTLDCFAETPALALKSAQRFAQRTNAFFVGAGIPWRVPVPTSTFQLSSAWGHRDVAPASMAGA